MQAMSASSSTTTTTASSGLSKEAKTSAEKYILQKIPAQYPTPTLQMPPIIHQQLKGTLASVLNLKDLTLGDFYTMMYANPLYDTSSAAAKEIFEMFSSESVNNLARLPEKSFLWFSELVHPAALWEGVPDQCTHCDHCGNSDHDGVKLEQENLFKTRFEILSSHEPSAVVEYELYPDASLYGKKMPMFILYVTTKQGRFVFEFGGVHLQEGFPSTLEEVVFGMQSIAKISFDFLFNHPSSPLNGVKNITFWDTTQCFHEERELTRELLFFYPLSNTYGFKSEIFFLAEGHGRPADDVIPFQTSFQKRFLVFVPERAMH